MSEAATMRVILRTLGLVILIGALAWLAWTVRSVLVLLLVSVTLAAGLSPIVDAISGDNPERRFLRLPRAVSILILYAGLFLVVGVGIAEVVPRLVTEGQDFAVKIPVYAEDMRQHVRNLENAYPSLSGLDEWLTTQAGEATSGIGDLSSQVSGVLRLAVGVVNGVFATMMLLVFTFYLIVDSDNLTSGALALLPPKHRGTAVSVAKRMRVKIGSWLIGQLVLSLTIGVATYIGLSLLGVPYALFLAVVAAIGELIPMVGPIIAAVPAVILALQISPALGLLTVGLYVIIQQLENHIIVPQVMRRAVDLPPVVIMAALLMGNELLGIVGALIALPVAAAVSVMVGEVLLMKKDRVEGVDRP